MINSTAQTNDGEISPQIHPVIDVFAGGHSYDSQAFSEFATALPGTVRMWQLPHGLTYIPDELQQSDAAQPADVTVHYDMPGAIPEPQKPSEEVVSFFTRRLQRSHGFVMLHHAIASWPLWPKWAEMLGGSFLYRPGMLKGQQWPDSGYAHEVTQTFTATNIEHPVLEGIPASFTLTDEPYLAPVFEDDVDALLVTDASRSDQDYYSSLNAISGDLDSQEGWQHPEVPALAAWTRTLSHEGVDSRLAYIQPGDTARTLGDPLYRRLVANAVRWVASSRRHNEVEGR